MNRKEIFKIGGGFIAGLLLLLLLTVLIILVAWYHDLSEYWRAMYETCNH